MDVVLRAGGPQDHEHVKWALYEAIAWNPERRIPPFEVALEHPQLLIYHRDWGRRGDLAVIAEADGDVVGVAACRLYTDEEHGHGYVDARTPEIAIAVAERFRGRGIGTRLLDALARTAETAAFERLSLSVDAANRARALYERCGYRELSVDDRGVRMVKDLGSRLD
jgi:ribosomal protein S18 acetylase RimI-like enzyme